MYRVRLVLHFFGSSISSHCSSLNTNKNNKPLKWFLIVGGLVNHPFTQKNYIFVRLDENNRIFLWSPLFSIVKTFLILMHSFRLNHFCGSFRWHRQRDKKLWFLVELFIWKRATAAARMQPLVQRWFSHFAPLSAPYNLLMVTASNETSHSI